MKVISQYEVNELNAGPKAKVDVEKILKNEYNASIRTLEVRNNIHKRFNLFIFRIKKFFYILRNRRINDVTIYQLPYNKSCKDSIKSKKSIGLIHDINGLRDMNNELLNREIALYQKFDVIISHNETMTKFLKEKGVKTPIIELQLFDYLVSGENAKPSLTSGVNRKVVFAGNFNKSLFLNELDESKMNFSINLYGVGNFDKNNTKYNYLGAFSPDELPLAIEGDLGLVWDGSIENSKDSNNNFLNYTRYNNPHKLSCYIAAGIPVIVWEEAACAKFVKEKNIGYVISNLYDINELDFSDYDIKLENVKMIQQDVINGRYTINAINKALEIIKE